MSAEQALLIVRGITRAADVAEDGTAETEERLRVASGKVCHSLMFFIEHPDNRVQCHVANTLKKCYERFPCSISDENMVTVRQAYANCIKTAAENTLQDDNETALKTLAWIVSRADGADFARAQDLEEVEVGAKDQGGQVAVKASSQKDDEQLRSAVLAEVIKLPQVVSVTLEADFVVVSTKTLADSRNANFLADLLRTMMEQGVHDVSLVNPHTRGAGGSSATSSTDVPADGEEDLGKADAAPGYLDDDLDQGAAERHGAERKEGERSAPQWTFFAQQTWLDQRRLQEYDDDPSIATRLAKKKEQQRQKREEEKSRIGRFASWLGWKKELIEEVKA
mmetsp:Transcript_28746/g.67610  ORF Transcript_28746/g.67610 Transcript_28746/m.67610 type:complete len:337 (-) Transcript_28746:65-1075(-)